MKVLIIGGGAREHTIYEALARSYHNPKIIVFAKNKNPGMQEAFAYEVGDILNLDFIQNIAKKYSPDLAIIGPDDPIGLGATDVLQSLNIPTFAPTKDLAQLESSKSFTRNLLSKYNIVGNPDFKVFTKNSTDQEILDYITNSLNSEYVVKYDALLGGKGVKLSGEHLPNIEDGLQYAKECISECGKVVIEEKFIGPEFSLISFADGNTIAPTILVQDNKRVDEDDKGSNTGGMGSISDTNGLLPFVTEQDKQEALQITKEVQSALKKETGQNYCGIMYGGFIKTKNGVRLIEFNARFGDPEAMNIVPLLKTDLLDIILACTRQTLHTIKIEFLAKASVCFYVVPSSYPDKQPLTEEQKIITLNKAVFNLPDIHTHFASVDLINETTSNLILRLSSSRALAFTAHGDSIEEAHQKGLKALSYIKGNIHFRRDIGSKKLIEEKIDLMQSF